MSNLTDLRMLEELLAEMVELANSEDWEGLEQCNAVFESDLRRFLAATGESRGEVLQLRLKKMFRELESLMLVCSNQALSISKKIGGVSKGKRVSRAYQCV